MKKIFMALILCMVSSFIYSDNIYSEWRIIDGQNVEITYYNNSVYSVFIPNDNNSIYLTGNDALQWYNKKRKKYISDSYKGVNTNYRVILVDTNIVYRSFYDLDNKIVNKSDSVEKVITNGKVRFLYNQFYYTPILKTHNGNQYWYFIVHETTHK